MSFEVAAAAYDRFMGRFSGLLSEQMADLAGVETGMDVIDVGCGTGALTRVLVSRLGPEHVTGVDPSESFVAAFRDRFPAVRIEHASAESLPLADDEFDAAIAQLVVHFMRDPVGGIREMARVTRPGGAVAACVWDHAGGGGPLAAFWRAVHDVDPGAPDEADLAGAREGHLAELCEAAGLRHVGATTLTVPVRFTTFAAWWEPFTLGVGPAGDYVARLDDERREALRARCERRLPPAPFEVRASAWCVRAPV